MLPVPSLTLGLAVWGILAPLLMYGWQAVAVADAERDGNKRVVVAVKKATDDGTAVCNGRVAEIESKLAGEALETAKLAREAGEREEALRLQLATAKRAADEAGATSTEMVRMREMVEDLCRAKSSCRDRARLKMTVTK
jgi:hypothetical protein